MAGPKRRSSIWWYSTGVSDVMRLQIVKESVSHEVAVKEPRRRRLGT